MWVRFNVVFLMFNVVYKISAHDFFLDLKLSKLVRVINWEFPSI